MTAGPALSPVPWFQFIFKSESPSVCLQVTVFKCNFASDTINISRAHVCPRRWAEACVCISLTNMKIGAGTQGVRLRNGSPPVLTLFFDHSNNQTWLIHGLFFFSIYHFISEIPPSVSSPYCIEYTNGPIIGTDRRSYGQRRQKRYR